jgi:hypothetical protein
VTCAEKRAMMTWTAKMARGGGWWEDKERKGLLHDTLYDYWNVLQ